LDEKQLYQTSKLIDRWHKIDRSEFHNQAAEIIVEEKLYKELVELMESKNLQSLPPAVRDHQSVKDLANLMTMLSESGVKSASFDFSVIRGMDYYGGIVFEVFDSDPENTRSMFGGGRYDGLVSLFGVESVPTVGFGMGDVTLQRFLETHKLLPSLQPETDVIVILVGDIYENAQPSIKKLRRFNINVAIDSSGRKLDAQIKNAVKSGVRYALFIGEKELSSNKFNLRDLQKGQEQELTLEQIASTLAVRHEAK